MNASQRECPRDTVMETLGWSFFPFHLHSKQDDFCTKRKQWPLKIQDPPAEGFLRYERLVKVPQLCPTLCDPMDCNLPGSSVHGILQARIPEWVAIPLSLQPRDWTQVAYIEGEWILYQLSHQESPRILEWVAYSFSRGSSRSKNWTGVSSFQADSLSEQFDLMCFHIVFHIFLCF